MTTVTFQDFDSKIFDCPYFRINSDDIKAIENDLNSLDLNIKTIIDAKILSTNKNLDIFLQKKLFKKICIQVELITDLIKNTPTHSDALIKDILQLSKDDIDRHTKNFTYDRFSLDSRISLAKRDLLYSTWIENSLINPKIYKVIINNNFITFKIVDDIIKLDLSSVLDKGSGIGTQLINKIKIFALQNNIHKISVITECENLNAVNFYLANEFKVNKFLTCFHFIS